MKITMKEDASLASLSLTRYDVAFTGEPLDPRGTTACAQVNNISDRVIKIEYIVDELSVVTSEGNNINADDIEDYFTQFQNAKILIESTTLGFVELYLILRSLRKLNVAATTIIYVEPLQYSTPRQKIPLNKRDFDLSSIVHGYKAIPGAVLRLSDRAKQRGVFFLGYEERRLEQALEDYEMVDTARCTVIFGVPAFQPGWEMNAFANNIRVIRDKKIRGGVKFCGAEDPAAAFGVLKEIYDSLEENENMFVAPIGTKPHGIGVALFVSMHDDVKIIYDHPARKKGRTDSVSRWHSYEVVF